jgi:hypothetical protein
MVDSEFIPGRLPHFIFVRDAGSHSDTDLLHLFGLATFRPTQSPWWSGPHVFLADDGEWTMVADDCNYTLWHMPSTEQAIHQLGHTFDVFAASVGDCDCSFDFVYYRDGRVARRYVVDDRGGVVENIGEPLPGEAAAFREITELRIVRAIAVSLGIRINHTAQKIRAYDPPWRWQRAQNPAEPVAAPDPAT